jgi:hypothetical protein
LGSTKNDVTEREFYRAAIKLAGILAAAAPLLVAGLALIFGGAFSLAMPWVGAKAILGGVAGSLLFGVPVLLGASIFLRVARSWSGRAHCIAFLLSPILVAGLMSGVLSAILASPPNQFPTVSELPILLARFSLVSLLPGYAFVLVSLLVLKWLRVRGQVA